MKFESSFVSVNGAQLYMEAAGAGPALLLLHGFGLDSRMWDDQFEAFARQYRVIRYDLRGFGRSQPPVEEPYSHADDLKALLKHLDLEQAHLLGLSLGGSIAVNATIAYPSMVNKLVLVDSALGGYRWSQSWNELIGPIWRRGRQGNVGESRQLWMAHPVFAPAMQQQQSRLALQRMITDYSGWHWAHRDPEQDLDPPAVERLEAIKATTLIVVGADDLPDFQAIAAMLQRDIPDARQISIPGAGHMTNMEKPALFNKYILDFLHHSNLR
jgi:pimeloyl-ACP methyl ester carboxylesterase